MLFEVDPDADYYVGWAGADISGAKLTDWGASENNADAKMREGFIVDEATGLVTAVGEGATVIRATTDLGQTAECAVTVRTLPDSVSLTTTAKTLAFGYGMS